MYVKLNNISGGNTTAIKPRWLRYQAKLKVIQDSDAMGDLIVEGPWYEGNTVNGTINLWVFKGEYRKYKG